jgi:ribonuclease VapC
MISAASVVECIRVVGNRKPRLRSRIGALLAGTETRIVPVDESQVRFAEEGHARFGKGRGTHLGVLNFGDLFAYALARQLDVPLLFKGDDFIRTDVRVAHAA